MYMLLLLTWSLAVVVVVAASPFGHKLLGKEFFFNYTNFNHGSFGACPKTVLEYQSHLRLLQEQMPDPWMRLEYKKRLNQTRKELAAHLHMKEDVDQLVLVESASTAVNSILRSMAWKEGDIIMYYSVAYGMVKSTAKWLKRQERIEIIELPVRFPIHNETAAFVDPLAVRLEQLKRDQRLHKLRVMVMDHIASVPAVREPVQQLAQLVKSFSQDCFVLVDGAHALGQVRKLDISSDMTPIDAYLSNGHKWFYSPKGSAFLWVNASVVTPIFPEPTVISSANMIGETSFVERYSYTSTRDYTAFISMSAALAFRESLGGDEAIYTYVRTLALQAKHYLMDLWGTIALAPDSMEDFLVNIALPIEDVETGNALKEWLLEEHNVYMLVLAYNTELFYTRLSSQIYLELQDFKQLGSLVLEFVDTREISMKS